MDLCALRLEKISENGNWVSMKIMYVAPKYDYGKYERGLSFEHYNFFDSLYNMGNDIVYFDYMDILRKVGKKQMNSLLVETVETEKPELMFVFLFEYELNPKLISQISRSGKVITLNWFADDHWRFENYSRFWAPHFNWITTTDSEAIPKYYSIGYPNVIHSQWACNHYLYKKLELSPLYDVSFIGQAYGNRRRIIEAIQRTGIKVLTRGQGWASGKVSHEEMVEIFNRSRINLNLANASVQPASAWMRSIDRYALYAPGMKHVWRKTRSLLSSNSAKAQPISQIKGRNFEVPGCGGFLITDYVKGLEAYYRPDRDIVCYSTVEDLVEKIQYYLVQDDLRNEIAHHGWRISLERHTYVHRFNEIFGKLGLRNNYLLDHNPGSCREVSRDL
jgi:spore maturation protein CgeB